MNNGLTFSKENLIVWSCKARPNLEFMATNTRIGNKIWRNTITYVLSERANNMLDRFQSLFQTYYKWIFCCYGKQDIQMYLGTLHKRRRNFFGLFWYPPPPCRNFDPDLPNFYLVISCNIEIRDPLPPWSIPTSFMDGPLWDFIANENFVVMGSKTFKCTYWNLIANYNVNRHFCNNYIKEKLRYLMWNSQLVVIVT